MRPREIAISPLALGDTPFTFFTVPFKSKAVCVAVLIGLLASEVLFTLPKPIIVAVIPDTIPVKVGEAVPALVARPASKSVVLAFKSRAVWVTVLIGFAKSVVLFTFPRPTIVEVIPETLPVKVGDAIGAFRFRSAMSAFKVRSVALAFKAKPVFVAFKSKAV